MRDPCREGGAGEMARGSGDRLGGGRGDTARRLDGLLVAGVGDGVSRLSVDDLFIDEYGVFALMLPLGDDSPPALNRSRAAAAGFGELAAAYAVKGFLNMLLDFCGVCFGCSCALFCLDMLPVPPMGLAFRLQGW